MAGAAAAPTSPARYDAPMILTLVTLLVLVPPHSPPSPPSPSSPPGDRAAVAELLDRFHAAASRADEAAYFACFAPGGVFLGTDPAERWDVEAFRAYAHPHFAKGTGWTYVPEARHVEIAAVGAVAWFDETLRSAKYGLCRGTGVATKDDAGWRIAQYSLTFLVPNEKAGAVVEAIAAPPEPPAAR
jgi:hypothetical protein